MVPFAYRKLEQAGDLAGFDIDVDTAVSGVSSGTGHHGDGAGHGAQELSAAVLQNVTDGQLPTGGLRLKSPKHRIAMSNRAAVTSTLRCKAKEHHRES